MILNLNDSKWKDLTVFFEQTKSLPQLLEQWYSLIGSSQEHNFYVDQLFNSFLHQATITNAAFAVVPWLVNVCESGKTRHQIEYLADVCLVEANRITRGTYHNRKDTIEYPDWLMVDYFEAIRKAVALADICIQSDKSDTPEKIQLVQLRPALDGNANLAWEQWGQEL
ncbi:MAG: hypothetical protein RLZZ156_519 [Deinococcota bacterium]|jgi:hypothetical protein